MRMLATFEKTERLRHIGHLDIMRAMQRALRRSGLPVSYSKGFNPHILLTFASALSVGAAGECEIMEATLEEDVAPEAFMTAMNAALPPEMQLTSAHPIDERRPASMAMVQAASYDIKVLDTEASAKLREALPAFLEQREIITERKTKSGVKPCDIRPLLLETSMEGDRICALMVLTETLSCKPAMLMAALCAFAGIDIPRVMVTRKRLFGRNAEGQLQPLEEL